MRIALIISFITSAALAQVPGQFHPAGKTRFARSGHTATLLPDGRVFFAGGICPTSIFCSASTEIFDPATGESREAAPLQIPRKDHSALLLGDGRILLAGGDEPVAGFGRLELIDPASGISTIPEFKVFPRVGGVALLLQNGNIFLGCGQLGLEILNLEFASVQRIPSPRGFIGICEAASVLSKHRIVLMDQEMNLTRIELAENGWFSTQSSAYNDWDDLFGQTLSTLPDGRVIAAGGIGAHYYGWQATPVFALYDPESVTTQSQSLASGRQYHTACLSPDGLILAGGSTSPEPIARSTTLNLPASASAEIIRLDGSQSERRLQLMHPRLRHTCTLLNDGSVLLAGGEASGEVERYIPINRWPELHISAAVPVANRIALELYVSGPLPNSRLEPFVWVDGLPAPLLYSGPTQINVLVPAAARKGKNVPVRISDLGRQSNTVSVSLE